MNSNKLSLSRKTQNKSPKHDLSNQISNVKTLKSVKSIAMIYAYQPKSLKECLLKDRKAYSNFFSHDGKCKSNAIFLRSIISHFREWKVEIEKREVDIFQLILEEEEMNSEV